MNPSTRIDDTQQDEWIINILIAYIFAVGF
jgi:hypothetical protein